MAKKYNVAVVGATGVVGKEMIEVLEQRQFPVQELIPLASERSMGEIVSFHNQSVRVKALDEDMFDNVDIALFSAGASVSEEFAPKAAARGAVVIDNTSFFRMHEDIPLVVPEVNAHALKTHNGIIANPNCSTAQMVLALKPIHDAAGLERVVISTYQSVSGAGKDAMLELEGQSRTNLSGGEYAPRVFQHFIAFNLIPQIDVFLENGYTKEEMKMVNETRKILELPNLAVTATAVRVPVFIGHSESINIQTKRKITAKQVRDILDKMPGVKVMDNPAKGVYPTPRDISGKDDVFIGRIREDVSVPNGIELWCVADNLRKGAALNSVQIAESLIEQGML